MFASYLATFALAKEIAVPGSYSDFVSSELQLSFVSKDNFDSFVIFPNTENFIYNDHPLKKIYTNPTSLKITSNGNFLNYSFIQIEKGQCDSLDFILNKNIDDWVEIKSSYQMAKIACFAFANSQMTKSNFYTSERRYTFHIFTSYILDEKSFIKWDTPQLSLNYTTAMLQVQYDTRSEYSFGINKDRQKSEADFYCVPLYDSSLESYLIIDDIVDFRYGNYNVNVKESYNLSIPANSYMISFGLKYARFHISCGTYSETFHQGDYQKVVGWSFLSDSYLRITGYDNISFVIIKNASNVLHCKEDVTIIGSKSYTLNFYDNSKLCVYAVANDGDIQVSYRKYAKFYDENGAATTPKDKYQNSVVAVIDTPNKNSSIKFKVGGKSDNPYVIRNTIYSNNFRAYLITENGSKNLNDEWNEEDQTWLKVILYSIYACCAIVPLALILLFYCLIKKCYVPRGKREANDDKLQPLTA